jgi:hypothetical protein
MAEAKKAITTAASSATSRTFPFINELPFRGSAPPTSTVLLASPLRMPSPSDGVRAQLDPATMAADAAGQNSSTVASWMLISAVQVKPRMLSYQPTNRARSATTMAVAVQAKGSAPGRDWARSQLGPCRFAWPFS